MSRKIKDKMFWGCAKYQNKECNYFVCYSGENQQLGVTYNEQNI